MKLVYVYFFVILFVSSSISITFIVRNKLRFFPSESLFFQLLLSPRKFSNYGDEYWFENEILSSNMLLGDYQLLLTPTRVQFTRLSWESILRLCAETKGRFCRNTNKILRLKNYFYFQQQTYFGNNAYTEKFLTHDYINLDTFIFKPL